MICLQVVGISKPFVLGPLTDLWSTLKFPSIFATNIHELFSQEKYLHPLIFPRSIGEIVLCNTHGCETNLIKNLLHVLLLIIMLFYQTKIRSNWLSVFFWKFRNPSPKVNSWFWFDVLQLSKINSIKLMFGYNTV